MVYSKVYATEERIGSMKRMHYENRNPGQPSGTERESRARFIVGLIMAVLAVPLAFTAGFTGIVSGIGATVIAVIALILGLIGTRKHWSVVIIGGFAIVMAITMVSTATQWVVELHNVALEMGNAPMVVRYSDRSYMGVMGVLSRAYEDGADPEELNRQLTIVSDEMNGRSGQQ